MFCQILDLLQFPRYSCEGARLNNVQRLTFGWLWTDDPQFARVDMQLDHEAAMRAQRNRPRHVNV